jgi:hypothetical protein
MSLTYDLPIKNILDILKILNNSDEIIKYYKNVYNKFWSETTILHESIAQMFTVNFATNKALTQAENATNKAIENIKIVKPLKTSNYPNFDKLWDNTNNSLIVAVKKALYFEVIAKTSILVTQIVMKIMTLKENTDIEDVKKTSLMNKVLYKNEELSKIMYSLAKLMRKTNTLKTLGALAEYTLKKSLLMRNIQKLHEALFMIVHIVNIASTITIKIAKQHELSLFFEMVKRLDTNAIVTNQAIINAINIKKTNSTKNNDNKQKDKDDDDDDDEDKDKDKDVDKDVYKNVNKTVDEDVDKAATTLLIFAEIPNEVRVSHKHRLNKAKLKNMDIRITMTANAITESVNCIYTIYSIVLLAEKEVRKLKSQYTLRNMTDI